MNEDEEVCNFCDGTGKIVYDDGDRYMDDICCYCDGTGEKKKVKKMNRKMKIEYCCEAMMQFLKDGYKYEDMLRFKKCPYCNAEIEIIAPDRKEQFKRS